MRDIMKRSSIVHRNTGFTLIELLVVIAIIALLMGILMPALQRVKEMSKKLKCATNLRSLYMAMFMYSEDFNGKVSLKDSIVDRFTYREWYARFHPYLKSPLIYECPSMNKNESFIKWPREEESDVDIWDRPINITYTGQEHVFGSRDYNATGSETTIHQYTMTELGTLHARDHWVSILFADGLYEVNGWGSWSPARLMEDLVNTTPVITGDRARYRHSGYCNFLCSDGTVGSLDDEYVLDLPNRGWREIKPSMLK
jgi:prepilin-type N-terminal cleavage/methylation domain-containing protein